MQKKLCHLFPFSIVCFFYVSLHFDMNRLQYWIKAQTQYSVHSPFVFDMYRKVLFAQLPKELLQQVLREHATGCRQYHELVYKLTDHYHLQQLCYDEDEAVLQGDPQTFGTVKVVCLPHGSRLRELRWNAQCGNSKYNVSIDLFDVGLLMSHPKLHKQHFLLK